MVLELCDETMDIVQEVLPLMESASIKVRGVAREILLKMCTKQPDSVPEVVGALKKLRGDWRITSFAESIRTELFPTLQTLVRHDNSSIRAEAILVRNEYLASRLLQKG
eukprot:Stramenopile-MAST_4_protein_5267